MAYYRWAGRIGRRIRRAPVPEKVFDDLEEAKRYAKSSGRRGQRIGRLYARLLAQQGFEEGGILDAGTGSGEVPIELARAFPEAKVIGLDLSGPLLEIAWSNAEKAGLSPRLLFEKGDLLAMPFADDTFDVVVSLNTLHVVDDPVAMLNEIERVLSPHGIFMLSDIKRSWLGLFMPILKTAYNTAEVKAMLGHSRMRAWRLHDSWLWVGVGTGTANDKDKK